MADRTLTVHIVGDNRSLSRALRSSGGDIKRFDASVKGLGVSFTRMAAVAGGALAGLGIAAGLKNAVSAASNLSEQINKSNVVFGQSADAIKAWSETTASSMGLSQRAALEAAGGFGQMLQTAGLTEPVAAKFSQTLVGLAADMASFNNIDPAEALLKLKSGLAGEAEPLRTVGVLLSEARVKQEAYATGIAQVGKELTEGQKVQARYQLILKDTAKQQGDFARTSDSLANAQRRVRAQLEEAAAGLGNVFLPAIANVTDKFAEFIDGFSKARGVRAKFDFAIDGLENIGRELFDQAREVFDNIDWESAMQTARREALDAIRGLFEAIGRIDFRQVGQFLGRALSQAFNDVAAFLRSVDWGNVGRAIVQGIGDFLKGVDWRAVALGTIRLLVAAFKGVASLLLGIGQELGGALMRGIGAGIDRLVDFVLRKLLAFVNKVLGVTAFLGRFDPFKGTREKVQATLKGMEADVSGSLGRIEQNAKDTAASVSASVSKMFSTVNQAKGALPEASTHLFTGGADLTQTTAAVEKRSRDAEAAAAAQKAALAKAAKARKAVADAAKKAADAAKAAQEKAQQAFDDLMDAFSLRLDRARQTATLRDDIATLEAQQRAVQARIKVAGRTLALQREEFEIQREIADLRREQRNQRQFRALGLTAGGEEPVAGVGSLRKRLGSLTERIKGTTLDTAKTRAQLARIARVLSGQFGKVGADVRDAITRMFDDINSALNEGKDKTKGPLTKERVVDSDALLAGLGLSPDQLRLARSRLSKVTGAGATAGTGRVPATSPDVRGLGRQAVGVQINGNVTVISDDPDDMQRKLQKKARRRATQTTGPHAGNSTGTTR